MYPEPCSYTFYFWMNNLNFIKNEEREATCVGGMFLHNLFSIDIECRLHVIFEGAVVPFIPNRPIYRWTHRAPNPLPLLTFNPTFQQKAKGLANGATKKVLYAFTIIFYKDVKS